MKKLILLMLISIVLCGCTVSNEAIAIQAPAEIEQTQSNAPDEMSMHSPAPTPSPTPMSLDVSIELPAVISDNSQFLSSTNAKGEAIYEGFFYVEFDEGRGNNAQLNRPSMPTYIWYLNGAETETVGKVVVEFDLIETIHPLHPSYFGYDKGFFIGIHNFETIPVFSPWETSYESHFTQFGDADRECILTFYEFAISMEKYVEQVGNHITISIPYSEFQNSSKNLTLQFYPGAIFGNLQVKVYGAEGLNQNIINSISIPIDTNTERELLSDELLSTIINEYKSLPSVSSFEDSTLFRENFNSLFSITHQALSTNINPDGTINMPVSEYNLGEYADEVQGKYAVIPEGLVPAFINMSEGGIIEEEPMRQVLKFVLDNMIDENGQFYGIYDIEQQKIVATDRKVSALPILSAMLYIQNINGEDKNILMNEDIDSIVNAIIANNLVHIDGKLYYAPNGLTNGGVMHLKLFDFAISEELLRLFGEYSYDRERLDEEFGCAMLMEGFANSFELVLEGQEQNATKLPSSELKVIFLSNGDYILEPSETFSIDNSYFSMGLGSFEFSAHYVGGFAFNDIEDFSVIMNSIGRDKNGIYDDRQEQQIREATAMYAEFYNAHHIYNLFYLSCLDVANFIKGQPVSNIYGPEYNVNTGEMIYDNSVEFYPEFQWALDFRARFGSPTVSANWFNLFGLFNDKERVPELARLTMLNYDIHMGKMLQSHNYDYSDSNLYADNGLDMWGYDCFVYILTRGLTAEHYTHFYFETSGTNMNREDWSDYMRRKLNEHRDDDSKLTREEAIPFFYDHLPEIEITD